MHLARRADPYLNLSFIEVDDSRENTSTGEPNGERGQCSSKQYDTSTVSLQGASRRGMPVMLLSSERKTHDVYEECTSRQS